MSCIALVRCVLVLLCGLAGVVWYLDAGFNFVKFILTGQYYKSDIKKECVIL